MDDTDTLENIFGFENESESEPEEENEVTVVSENKPEAEAEAPDEPPKRRINRKPIPKLDSNVLLSENGIIKLQNLLAKTSFKRGKGHEKENLNRLINVYQLWGHNLYPRLKFKSIIERTEKLCSEKRLRLAYSTWREANKYKRKYETDEYNTSGIIRADDDPTAEVDGSFNMDVDIFKPFSGANTTTTTTTTTTTNNSNSNSTTNPPLPLSRLDHPLTEEDRAFMRANRERALQKLRQKKEELKRQRELEQQQQQQQQSILEQASTSATSAA